jgi:nucleotide-binding universal stress UspA family protein
MYKKIVVPLDGSKLAECVLPHVESIARGCGTEEVILVSVTERIIGSGERKVIEPTEPLPGLVPVVRMPVVVGKMQKQADRYLNRIAKRLNKKGLKVRTEVLLGDPAHEIAEFAEEDSDDLIIMASHGKSGLGRWTHGSVADRVFRVSTVPVLMVRAPVLCD